MSDVLADTAGAEVLRADRVEIYDDKDRKGALPRFTWSNQRGILLLVRSAGHERVVYQGDDRRKWAAPLPEVRFTGLPEPPFGVSALAERALRLEIAGKDLIVAFTGEETDASAALSDVNMGRLSGDFDALSVLKSAQVIWRNRHFWRISREAANAWRELLSGPVRPVDRMRHLDGGSDRRAGDLRTRYSESFKERAVAAAQSSRRPVTAVARDLGVSPTTLRRWIDAAAKAHGTSVD